MRGQVFSAQSSVLIAYPLTLFEEDDAFLVEKYQLFSMLDVVVLGGELAVPYSRNPLMRG